MFQAVLSRTAENALSFQDVSNSDIDFQFCYNRAMSI
jgi:hypothetical protein